MIFDIGYNQIALYTHCIIELTAIDIGEVRYSLL